MEDLKFIRESVVRTAVRTIAQAYNTDMRISSEFFDALNEEVRWLVEDAVGRAYANGRKTLKPYDV